MQNQEFDKIKIFFIYFKEGNYDKILENIRIKRTQKRKTVLKANLFLERLK